MGEPTEIEHESKWIDEKWVSTDEVVHFQYDDTKGNYNIRQDCETGEWYIDYLLDDHKESCDDVNVSIGLDELISIREKTLNKFSGIISEECKIKVYDWYSGCDMPIEF